MRRASWAELNFPGLHEKSGRIAKRSCGESQKSPVFCKFPLPRIGLRSQAVFTFKQLPLHICQRNWMIRRELFCFTIYGGKSETTPSKQPSSHEVIDEQK